MARGHSREAVTSRLRLRGYDYSTPGLYFVTVCTERQHCLFGDVRDGFVDVSLAGQVIESWWDSIPLRFPGVMLDERVVMPNHLHGIIVLGAEPDANQRTPAPTLSKVMQWFKTRTTYDYILGVQSLNWQRFPGRLWQQDYYEHIVRSEAALERIQAYIEANPSQWPHDDNNPNRTDL